MYFTRFCVCYTLIIVVVVEAEIFTLTKNKDVRCVATDADISSTIYLHPPTNSELKYENEFECKNDSKQRPYVQILPNQQEQYYFGFAVCARDNDWKETKKYMGIITDQRWEALPIHENRLHFTDLEPKTKYGFSVCSEQNNFTITETKKCHNNKQCNSKRDAEKFQKNKVSTGICKNWYHYNLKKHRTGKLSTFRITEESMKIITSYSTATQDNDLQISTKSTSFWKLHKMNFIEATQATKKASSMLISHSGPLYVSMLVYLNSKSSLLLNLTSNNVTIFKNIRGKDHSKAWQKIELTITSVNQTTLYVRRRLTKNKTNGYWAIDEIKFYTRKMRVYRAELPQENPLHTCKSLTTVAHGMKKDFLPRNFENPCEIHCGHLFGKDPFCENYTIYSHDTNKSVICKDTSNSPDKIPVLFAELSLEDISDDSITIQVQQIHEKNFTKLDNLTFSTLDEIRNKTFVIGNLSTREFQYKVGILVIIKNQSSIEGKPELITYRRSLLTTNRTSNNFNIKWSHPENKSSTRYIIKYQCQQKFCNQQSATVIEQTKNLFFKSELKPSTSCWIKLYILQHNKQEQFLDKIEVNSREATTIEYDEMPYNITFSKNLINVTFQDCGKFSGPIEYNFEFRCISASCINNSTDFSFLMDSYRRTVTFDHKLLPFTSYTVIVNAIRSNMAKLRMYTLLKTPPGKPRNVRNLSVDCWGSTILCIKWQPPYPPTGKISHYVITYRGSQASTETKVNDTYPCSAEDDFICANITKLEREIYSITVQAKNTNFDKLGMPETISSSSVSNARKILENFTLTPLPPNEISLIWENVYLKHLYIEEEDGNLITKNCQQSCEHRIKIKDETNYTIGVWSLNCSSEKTLIKIEVTSFPQLSTNPLTKLCLEENCSLLIPKPNTTTNTSNFSISVRKTDDEESGWVIHPLTLHENNYFQVEIGDSPGKAVSLQNKSYIMYLQDNLNNETYPLFHPTTNLESEESYTTVRAKNKNLANPKAIPSSSISKVLTLLNGNNITCVLTEDLVNSALYITSLDGFINVNRTSREISNWTYSDWQTTKLSTAYGPVVDQRWMDFSTSDSGRNGIKLRDIRVFSVCVNDTSSLGITSHDSNNKMDFKIAPKNKTGKFCKWDHFVLTRKNRTIVLQSTDGYNQTKTADFNQRWLIFDSDYYKLHDYTFVYSNITSSNNSYININSSNCISMFVSVDQNCCLYITLESDNEVSNIIVNGFNKKNALKAWKRVEIRSNCDGEKKLFFDRRRFDNETLGYWAIDDILQNRKRCLHCE